jgi:hypothetical protein
MKLLCAVVALAGCDTVFDLDVVELPRDASRFDAFLPVQDCPASYSTELVPGGSRYRVILQPTRPGAHQASCVGDTGGRFTHLAVLETQLEQTAVQTFLNGSGQFAWYVGAIQPMGQATARLGWVWLTGEDVSIAAFDPFGTGGGEPNDLDGVENSEENVVYIRAMRDGLIDVLNTNEQGAICECDGRAMDAAAAAAYAANG